MRMILLARTIRDPGILWIENWDDTGSPGKRSPEIRMIPMEVKPSVSAWICMIDDFSDHANLWRLTLRYKERAGKGGENSKEGNSFFPIEHLRQIRIRYQGKRRRTKDVTKTTKNNNNSVAGYTRFCLARCYPPSPPPPLFFLPFTKARFVLKRYGAYN